MTAPLDAWAWLESREPGIPEPLRTRMREAVIAAPSREGPAVALGQAALACMREALRCGDDRSAALHLLAADALLTHAAEAAVLAGGQTLRAFRAEFGAAALGRRCLPEPPA